MELDRLQYRPAERAAQKRQRKVLVQVVHLARDLATATRDEVPDVVQESRGAELGIRAFRLCQLRALQRMLELAHQLAAVAHGGSFYVKGNDFLDLGHGLCKRSAISISDAMGAR